VWPDRAETPVYFTYTQAGEVERADKLLNDCAWDVRQYTRYVDAFRKDYQHHGWKWAVALCDLRK
jgi:hypothetical protein